MSDTAAKIGDPTHQSSEKLLRRVDKKHSQPKKKILRKPSDRLLIVRHFSRTKVIWIRLVVIFRFYFFAQLSILS